MNDEQLQLEASDLWEEDIWDELLAYVEEGRVIPVVGPDLLQVNIGGRRMLFDRYIAEQLAAKFSLPAVEDRSLNEVVCQLSGIRRREALYAAIRGIVRGAQIETPTPLRQLAEIRHLNLFVSTTFDSLLEQALNETRFGGRAQTDSIAYAPNNVKDLVQPGSVQRPTVYHLLGKLSTAPNYVICDEDLLEFVCALQNELRRPERLFDELNANHLLILGEGYPDWLTRFFLRATRQQRLCDGRNFLEILADSRTAGDSTLVYFLKHFSSRTRIFRGGGAVEFVHELWRRWRERFSAISFDDLTGFIPPPAEMPAAAVFISYAREDLPAVQRLKTGLEAAGLTVWFDFERLAGGDAFERKIRDCIGNCILFVPVISSHTESRQEGFFRREWHFAEDRALNIDPNTPFVVPVVVDGTKEFKRVPDSFLKKNLTWLDQGGVTQEFAELLRRLCKV